MLKTLDIQPIHANTPQAKGRVERANQTLQDRLVKELRLRGIDEHRKRQRLPARVHHRLQPTLLGGPKNLPERPPQPAP